MARYMSDEEQSAFLTGKTVTAFRRYNTFITIFFEGGSSLSINIDDHSSFEPFLEVEIDED